MTDIKSLKQKKQYEKVNRLYINGNITLSEACGKTGICVKTYYNIRKKMDNTNNNNSNQKGGNKMSNNGIEISETNEREKKAYEQLENGIRGARNKNKK
jgi:hypothetical protein